jgi:hypothetical protein
MRCCKSEIQRDSFMMRSLSLVLMLATPGWANVEPSFQTDLHPVADNAGLPSGGGITGGWENTSVAGVYGAFPSLENGSTNLQTASVAVGTLNEMLPNAHGFGGMLIQTEGFSCAAEAAGRTSTLSTALTTSRDDVPEDERMEILARIALLDLSDLTQEECDYVFSSCALAASPAAECFAPNR